MVVFNQFLSFCSVINIQIFMFLMMMAVLLIVPYLSMITMHSRVANEFPEGYFRIFYFTAIQIVDPD